MGVSLLRTAQSLLTGQTIPYVDMILCNLTPNITFRPVLVH